MQRGSANLDQMPSNYYPNSLGTPFSKIREKLFLGIIAILKGSDAGYTNGSLVTVEVPLAGICTGREEGELASVAGYLLKLKVGFKEGYNGRAKALFTGIDLPRGYGPEQLIRVHMFGEVAGLLPLFTDDPSKIHFL